MEGQGKNTKPERTFRTQLAQRLWQIRPRIISTGQKLLDREELEREIAEQRGVIENEEKESR